MDEPPAGWEAGHEEYIGWEAGYDEPAGWAEPVPADMADMGVANAEPGDGGDDELARWQADLNDDDAQAPPHIPPQVHDDRADQGEGPLDILIAEDNEVNRIVFSQILAGTRWRWALARDGVEAVELYRRHRPGLVLMDVSMPGMNGLEATAAIREIEESEATIERARRTPIVGVTAHALKGDRDRCIEAGMDDYLTKPVSPKGLIDKIDQWLAAAEHVDRRASA